MALHIIRGKQGEVLALEFLRKHDFVILACNWRYKHYETDIIAAKDEVIHFIEVKTRHSMDFGYPEQSVSRKKFASMKQGAACFMRRYPIAQRLRFDILAISRHKDKDEYFFIEDAYL